MNDQLTAPKILESPVPSVGAQPKAQPRPAEAKLEPRVEPKVETKVETRASPDVAPGAHPIEIDVGGAKGTIEAGAQMLLAMQVGNMRGAEAGKAYEAWDKLQPKIEAARSKGKWVNVGLSVDVPETVDVIGGVAGVGDVSQIVHFRSMWIEVTDTREEAYGLTESGQRAPPGGGISERDPTKDREPVSHPHTRIVETHLHLPPYATGERHGGVVLHQKPGFIGTYRPVAFRSVFGSEGAVKAFGMHRRLTIGDRDHDDIAMIDTNDGDALWPTYTWVDAYAKTAEGTFSKKTESLETQYVFSSKFSYQPGKIDMLAETVQAEDKDPQFQKTWSATIYWAKL